VSFPFSGDESLGTPPPEVSLPRLEGDERRSDLGPRMAIGSRLRGAWTIEEILRWLVEAWHLIVAGAGA
jgi:hypothetical protein